MMTVKQIHNACEELINKGYGDHAVLVSDDDEGNGFHEMFYLFTAEPENVAKIIEYCNVPRGTDPNGVVLLG